MKQSRHGDQEELSPNQWRHSLSACAERQNNKKALARHGIKSLTLEQGIDVFEQVLSHNIAHIIPINVEKSRERKWLQRTDFSGEPRN